MPNLRSAFPSQVFSAAEQNAIIAAARTEALNNKPAGLQLYRLTFDQWQSGPPFPQARITGKAWYGVCGPHH